MIYVAGRAVEDVVAEVRARPEFGPGSEWLLYAASVGGRVKSEVLDRPSELSYWDAGELAGAFDDVMHATRVDGHPVLWGSLRVSASDWDLHWGADEPLPEWMPMDADFNLDHPALWLFQWRLFDKRPPSQLPQFWKDRLEVLGAWNTEADDIAIDAKGNPLHGPKFVRDHL